MLPFEILAVIVLLMLGVPLLVGYLIYRLAKYRQRMDQHPAKPPVNKRPLNREDMYIVHVAAEFGDEEKFMENAKQVAGNISFAEAAGLVKYFHANIPPPPELLERLGKYGLLGGWMDICQNAIFEILYNYGGQAVTLLNEIAFGVYDWTQYKAVDVLCRLAANGVQKDEIIDGIDREIRNFRYEAVFPSLSSLARLEHDPRVKGIYSYFFNEYRDNPEMEILRQKLGIDLQTLKNNTDVV